MFKEISDRSKIFALLVIGFIGGYLIILMHSQSGISLAEVFGQYNMSIFHKQSFDNSCTGVLQSGRFVEYDRWEPYGCTLHNYSTEDIQTCALHGKKRGSRDHLVLIGDSRIKYIYDAFRAAFNKSEKSVKFYSDKTYSTDYVLIDFLWRAQLSEIKSTLQNLSALPRDKRPVFILAGSAAWCILEGNATDGALNEYKANLKALQPYITKLQHTTTLIWMMQPRMNWTAYNIRAPNHAIYITDEQMDLYNTAANETLQSSPFQLWSTARDVAEGFYEDMWDGMHVSPRANYWNVQLLLNVFCNQRMTHIQATCCRANKAVQTRSIIILKKIILGVILIICLTVFIIFRRRESADHLLSPETKSDPPERHVDL